MKSEWKNCTLDDIGTIKTGKTPPAKIGNAYGDGLPFITPRDMDERKFIRSTERCLTEDGVNSIKNYVIPEYSVSVSCIGSDMGKVIMTDKPSITNQQINSIIVNTTKYFPEYIYYNLSNRRKELRNIAGGTTMPIINKTDFSKISIQIPPLQIQKKIAHILSTLDDKIELNRKMNETLEAMAQALFKSWFVDFDPVHAKAQAKSEEELEVAATKLDISKEILDLFPSEFEESEMGMIPKGWKHDTLSKHISVTKGKSYKSSELEESSTALVTLKSFLRGGGYRTDGVKPYTGKYKDEQIIQPGELIMAYTDVTQAADVIGKPAIVLPDEAIDILVASLDVGIVRTKTQKINIMFLYHLFKTKRFQGYILGHTSGTTVLHLAKGWLDGYNILLPSQEIMDRYNKLVSSLFNKMRLNIEEIRSLQKTRDTLLPKLLSGELDVSNIHIGLDNEE